MQIKKRQQAALDGDKKYWTGRPCGRGHDSPRYTTTGICCACNREAAKSYNSRVRQTINAKAQGMFAYMLHPDDHAAMLAYCQALDMQRGRVPQVPEPPPKVEPHTPEQIRRMRELAFGKAVDVVSDEQRREEANGTVADAALMRSMGLK